MAVAVSLCTCQCTQAGRFPVTSDTTCKTYTYCVFNSATGSYLTYNYSCSGTSIFNPNTAQCTADPSFVCSDSDTTTASSETTTSEATTTESADTTTSAAQTTTDSNSNCTQEGRFADTSDDTCKHYTLCVLDTNQNEYIGYYYPCPGTSIFNPNTSQCTAPENYDCGSGTTTDATETTTAAAT